VIRPRPQWMACNHIHKKAKALLKQIFCVVGKNSPYNIDHFVRVLLDAADHQDFTNNTCVRVGGPTGETVFSRLKGADVEEINQGFHRVLDSMFISMKRKLRNRKVALAFDITDEPYYGKVEGLWIHPQQPVQGSTGCFKFITVSCNSRDCKFILGSMPVRIGADIVELVMELAKQARRHIQPEILLFDRGFDDYRLIEAMQNAGLRYQILWRKNKWTKVCFKKMKRGDSHEVTRVGTYSRAKSKYKIKARFVLLKKYRRYPKGRAYDWVFCTNTRQLWQHNYVDKYRKRWSIETVFRVLDSIQIKTTSTNVVIRHFINIFCCLIYNLWKLADILEGHVSLKNFIPRVLEIVVRVLRISDDPGS
jgi:hypothetical protein